MFLESIANKTNAADWGLVAIAALWLAGMLFVLVRIKLDGKSGAGSRAAADAAEEEILSVEAVSIPNPPTWPEARAPQSAHVRELARQAQRLARCGRNPAHIAAAVGFAAEQLGASPADLRAALLPDETAISPPAADNAARTTQGAEEAVVDDELPTWPRVPGEASIDAAELAELEAEALAYAKRRYAFEREHAHAKRAFVAGWSCRRRSNLTEPHQPGFAYAIANYSVPEEQELAWMDFSAGWHAALKRQVQS